MNDLSWAAALLAVDPGLGAVLRGPPGQAREAFLRAVREGLPEAAPFRKMPCGISDDRLLGGLDLAATLAAGRPVAERGLLAACDGGVVVVAMAERLEPGVVARLTAAMDAGAVSAERDGRSCRDAAAFGVIALDEGIDEAAPAALMDRLAFHCSSEAGLGDGAPDEWAPGAAGLSGADLSAGDPSESGAGTGGPHAAAPGGNEIAKAMGANAIAAARDRLSAVAGGDGDAEALVVACARLGIASLRAPLLAWRAARAAAAFAGRAAVAAEDLAVAARLVLAPRATMVPGDEAPEPPPPPAPDETPDDSVQQEQTGRLADRVLEAARAALPADLLAGLARGAAMRARDGGSGGVVRRNAQRGRTVGVRLGEPRGGARLHLLATLRAAAPWQRMRGAAAGRIAVRRSDFRLRRFHQATRTTTIFVVDASGSAAAARLAEAKGAVERLLAECYVRRDRVALLSMRGAAAEVLLPPTSSLARAKRSLAGMPGGGGTPLAAGFVAATVLADGVRRGGQTPVGVFLTDGRPNVALDGAHGRAVAEADACAAARAWRASGHAGLLVDMAVRPHPFARQLAEQAGARYLALPSAGSGALEVAVRGAVGG